MKYGDCINDNPLFLRSNALSIQSDIITPPQQFKTFRGYILYVCLCYPHFLYIIYMRVCAYVDKRGGCCGTYPCADVCVYYI